VNLTGSFRFGTLITQYTLVTLPCLSANLVIYSTAHLYQCPVII